VPSRCAVEQPYSSRTAPPCHGRGKIRIVSPRPPAGLMDTRHSGAMRTTCAAYDRGMTAATAIDERPDAGAGDPTEGAEKAKPRRVIPENIRRRLTPIAAWDSGSWAAAALIMAIAAILRFARLGWPPEKVFDEVYYATEGYELNQYWVEWRPEEDSAGNIIGIGNADYVVHPPLGKWIIGLGIRLFGYNAVGWRFMVAVAGIISVLILTRTARRMFRSTVLGCTAGLLMALDGMHFVLSRTAILDMFVMFFVLAAFACVVLDRDARRARWLRELENGLDPSQPGRAGRPRLTWSGVPWWRLGAGAMLGAACAVKWSAVFFIPVFVVLILWWEVTVRRTIGAQHPIRDTILDESGWIVAMGALAISAYLASWTGWFATDYGWKRHYLRDELGQSEPFILGPLKNLWAYHVDVYTFHVGLASPHPYQSWPWQWLILGRPVSFYRNDGNPCGAADCAGEITLLGTPALWWAFLPALAGLAWFGISRRDWRAAAIGAGVFAGIAPWFYYELKHRTMFYFYALPAEPFLVLAVTYCLGALITGPGVGRLGSGGRVRTVLALPAEDRRLYGTVFAAAFVALVAVCFWWYFPLYTGMSIPQEDWLRRMLLGSRWY
jgi:dolichyl-phosphate-mannose-protein mannosyltransferase